MKISRILHAGYLFESGQTQIVFDPIFENPFSKNCFAYPNVQFDYEEIKKANPAAVFISHYHDDHCSLESLKYLNRDVPVYLYCIHEELFVLLKQLGFKNVFSLKTDKAVRIGAFEVTPRLALDPDVDSIFQISAEGLNLLNVVDAWIDPQALSLLKDFNWDMILWPFQTMREIEVIAPELASAPELPSEWLEQIKKLNPRFLVPSSCQFIHEDWSWYRKAFFPISYKRFKAEIDALKTKVTVLRLNPGESVELTGSELFFSENLKWVIPAGPQNVDYEFDPDVKPQPTAEIAKRFPDLTSLQLGKVLEFCKSTLIAEYNKMNTGLSAQWGLVLYNHRGGAIKYHYEIQDGVMKLADIQTTEWITELPLVKLYSALEEGEQLSSMYIRMQGMPTDEISEDPLISCLFNHDVGSYQKNQLKKLYTRRS